jgi:hypothetical protein
MTHLEKLEIIKNDLYNFSNKYKEQNNIALSQSFIRIAILIHDLIEVFPKENSNKQVLILTKVIQQKLLALKTVLKFNPDLSCGDLTREVLDTYLFATDFYELELKNQVNSNGGLL